MITSTSNKRIKRVIALQNRRRVRQREKSLIIEGSRLALESLAARIPIEVVFYTGDFGQRNGDLVKDLAQAGAEVLSVSDTVMATIAGTESPPGLVAVLPFPVLPLPDQATLALIVDRIKDPGNLGTLMRTALAAGVEVVFLTEGTVDPYNPKVIRGAMGAHFHLPTVWIKHADLRERLSNLEIWIAEAGEGKSYDKVDWRKPVALVIGGEAHGPHRTLREIARNRVHIPMPGKTESLNAATAAAVILFEIARQRGMT